MKVTKVRERNNLKSSIGRCIAGRDKINGLKKKGFQEGLQLQKGWFEKKNGAKGQQRLGQARPPREPNQAAPAQLAQVTNVQEHRQCSTGVRNG